MELDKALSTDLNKIITPNEAAIQFLQGNIKSKINFECPDENCHAQVTCANIDKPIKQRLIDPYYKTYGEHSDQCLIAKEQIKKSLGIPEKNNTNSTEHRPVTGTYKLSFREPSIQKEEHSSTKIGKQSRTPSRKKVNPQSGSSPSENLQSKTITTLVDCFLNNESINIVVPTLENIHIQDLFIEIKGQEFHTLQDKCCIYYGEAWINPVKGGYSVNFKNRLTYKGKPRGTSFFISDYLLEKSGSRKLNKKIMSEISDEDLKLVFIFSNKKPYVHFFRDSTASSETSDSISSFIKKTRNIFINIRCHSANYFDYRLIENSTE